MTLPEIHAPVTHEGIPAAVRYIARRFAVSPYHAAVIAELAGLGLMMGARHV